MLFPLRIILYVTEITEVIIKHRTQLTAILLLGCLRRSAGVESDAVTGDKDKAVVLAGRGTLEYTQGKPGKGGAG